MSSSLGTAGLLLVLLLAGPSDEQESDLLRRAQQHRRQGESDRALSELQSLLAQLAQRQDTKRFQASVLREIGEIHLDRKALKEAAGYFEQSISQDLTVAAVHYELGLAYREAGDNRKASLELQSAVDRGFRNTGALFFLVNAYFDSRQFMSGLERSQELIAAAPKSPDLMLRLGQLLFRHLFYREASKAFRIAYDANPENYEARFYLALTYHLLNQYQESIALLTPLAAAKPSAELLTLLASSQAQAGNYGEAEKILRDAIRREPRSPHPYLNLAFIALDQDRLQEAEGLLDRLRALGSESQPKVLFTVSRNSCREISADTAHPAAAKADAAEKSAYFYQLAVQMQAAYHYRAAVQLMRLALRHGPPSAALLNAAGMCCFNLESQSPMAVALLEQAVAADPNLAEAWHLLGRAYTRQLQTAKAIDALQKAVALQPNALYYTSLGRAYVAHVPESPEAGEQALRSFQKALALDPTQAMALYEAGRLLAGTQDLEKARLNLLKAIEIEPDFYEAYYALGLVLMRSGETDQARNYLAMFEQKRLAAKEQSVLGAGMLSEGRQ